MLPAAYAASSVRRAARSLNRHLAAVLPCTISSYSLMSNVLSPAVRQMQGVCPADCRALPCKALREVDSRAQLVLKLTLARLMPSESQRCDESVAAAAECSTESARQQSGRQHSQHGVASDASAGDLQRLALESLSDSDARVRDFCTSL